MVPNSGYQLKCDLGNMYIVKKWNTLKMLMIDKVALDP